MPTGALFIYETQKSKIMLLSICKKITTMRKEFKTTGIIIKKYVQATQDDNLFT
jgi:hypothetical protein